MFFRISGLAYHPQGVVTSRIREKTIKGANQIIQA
jgi:hypothetical protein